MPITPILVAVWLGPAHAGDAVSLEVVRKGQVGQSSPALVLTPNTDAETLDVDLACGGATASRRGGAPAGVPIRLVLETRPGTHACTGQLNATFIDGSSGQMPLQFEVQMLQPLNVTVDRSSVDTKLGELAVSLDRPAGRVQVVATGLDGKEVGRGEVDGGGQKPGTLIPVSWSVLGDVAQLSVKAYDTDGFWAGVDLFPWYYAVPHEDVIFRSGMSNVEPAETPKLDAALTEVNKIVSRYGKVAAIHLYVAGYTDRVGSFESNLILSRDRARAIASWFKTNGFPGNVYYQGFGERGLAVHTTDEQPEPANRRAAYIVAAEPPPASDDIPGTDWKPLR